MKKPIQQWLETIADPTIREVAISQIDEGNKYWPKDGMVEGLHDALAFFNDWKKTKEGEDYWNKIHNKWIIGQLETREVEATELEKPFSSWYGEEKLGFSYDMDKLTPEYKEDGTIILKPKKKAKIWVVIMQIPSGDLEAASYNEYKEVLSAKEDLTNHGFKILEVVEREYEIENQ